LKNKFLSSKPDPYITPCPEKQKDLLTKVRGDSELGRKEKIKKLILTEERKHVHA
jgi:hypothetical protein